MLILINVNKSVFQRNNKYLCLFNLITNKQEKRLNMNKVSEKSASNSRLISSIQSDNGQYQKYKQEYEKYTQKTDKSDFAGSPVLLNNKLVQLAKLKEIAEEENLTEELSWIEDEMTRLKSSLTSITSESTDNPTYYQFDFQALREKKAPLNIGKVLEACKILTELMI